MQQRHKRPDLLAPVMRQAGTIVQQMPGAACETAAARGIIFAPESS
jgi:hypothetical protein